MIAAAAVLLALRLAAPAVLFEEDFSDNGRGWQIDTYSRLQDGGYVIDARGTGAFPRVVAEPDGVRECVYRGQVRLLSGDPNALAGLLFRAQGTWANSYYFAVGAGSARYSFGKFTAGARVVLKEGLLPALRLTGETTTTLQVEALGDQFALMVNDTAVATVVDASIPTGGRLGVYAEAPARVRFDDLRAWVPEPHPRTLFRDDFRTDRGWPEDAYRRREAGAYHLANHGESPSFVAWNAATTAVGDAVIRLDASLESGSPEALFGLLWRVQDAEHYLFFILNPDGRWYAGVRAGTDATEVKRTGRFPGMRGGRANNSLEVVANGSTFTLSLNSSEVGRFSDNHFAVGAVGVYLQQAADVAFRDLVVRELPSTAATPPPPTPTPTLTPPVDPVAPPVTPTVPPAGPLLTDALTAPGDYAWPTDVDHAFEQGGYCLRAPADGSRTTLRKTPGDLADGLFSVRARPIAGPVTSSFGLAIRANPEGNSFYFLLLNACGRYYVGRCLDGRYQVLRAGVAPLLRGGDAGNTLTIEARGSLLRCSVNEQLLEQLADDSLSQGAVGLHAEHGLVACFRDLRVAALGETTGVR